MKISSIHGPSTSPNKSQIQVQLNPTQKLPNYKFTKLRK